MRSVAAAAALAFVVMTAILLAPFDSWGWPRILEVVIASAVAVAALALVPGRTLTNNVVALVGGIAVAAVAHLLFHAGAAMSAVYAIVGGIMVGLFYPTPAPSEAEQQGDSLPDA